MATIADKLTTIAGIKTDIRTAINGKGGSLTSGSPFSAYSAAISSLPSGGGGYPPDWGQIGYTGAPQTVLDAFSYAKTINDNWDPTATNIQGKFSNDKNLVYMPLVDTSRTTNMNNMFAGCTNLTTVPLLDTSSVLYMESMFSGCTSLSAAPAFNTSACAKMRTMFHSCSGLTTVPAFNTSACTNMAGMFQKCANLTTVPAFDTSQVNDMEFMFDGCSGLTSIPALNTSEVSRTQYMFPNCSSLQKITSLDMSKCTTFSTMFGYGSLPNLRFMLLKGLGTPSGVTSYDSARMYNCTNWGVDSTDIPDARQSLVDSLLTYSFDRATAGYATCTIKLSSNAKNQLTAQELADIQAKGYNITT